MATTPKLSTELLIQFYGTTIAKATDFSVSVNKEVIDVSTLDSAGWKEKLVDNKDWNISFSGLVTRGAKDGLSDWLIETTYDENDIVTDPSDNFIYISQAGSNTGNDPSEDDGTWWKKYLIDFIQLLEEMKENDEALSFALNSSESGDTYQYGDGYLTALDLSGSVGDKVTYSGSIEGTAALSTGTVT